LGSEGARKKYVELQLDSSLDDVSYVIKTHSHRDSVEGLPDLLLYCPNATLVIDEREIGVVKKITFMGEDVDVMIINKDTYIEDAGIQIIRTPGHTPGSISALYGNSLFIGGSIYIGPQGWSIPKQNYDRKMLLESLRRIAELKFDSLFPAHGRYVRGRARQKLLEFISGIT